MKLVLNEKTVTVKNKIEIIVDEKLYKVYLTNNKCNSIYQVMKDGSAVRIGKALTKLTGYSMKEFVKFIEESEEIEEENLEQYYTDALDLVEEVELNKDFSFNFDEEILDLDF